MSILFPWSDRPPPEFTDVLSSSFLSCLGFKLEPFSVHSLGSSLCSFRSKTQSFHVKVSTLSVTQHFYSFACLLCSDIQIFSLRYILNTTPKKSLCAFLSFLPFPFKEVETSSAFASFNKSLSIPPLPPPPSKVVNLTVENGSSVPSHQGRCVWSVGGLRRQRLRRELVPGKKPPTCISKTAGSVSCLESAWG